MLVPSGAGGVGVSTDGNYALRTALCATQGRSWGPDCSNRIVVHMSSNVADSANLMAAVVAIDAGEAPSVAVLKAAVRALLIRLRAVAPGRSVEVRVPPFGAVQCGAGPVHTRGTPPNVVETDAVSFVRIGTGRLGWDEAVASGVVRASGTRADLAALMPLWEDTPFDYIEQ